VKTYTLPNTDLIVSRLAYGCDHMGEWDRKPATPGDVRHAGRLIHTAHENGITLFDIADIYAFGKAETSFGKVLRESPGLRDELVIQSKCGVRYPDEPRAGDPPRIDCSREHIVESVEESLRRLGTDRLDILLLHIPDALMEPEDLAQAFDELESSGKVRYFGVSNHTATQIANLTKHLRQRLVVNQVQLSLDHPYPVAAGYEHTLEILDHLQLQIEMFLLGSKEYDPRLRYHNSYAAVAEAGTLDYCRIHDIQVQAFSPLRGALLNPTEDAKPHIKETARLLKLLADERGTSVPVIMLAWILRHPARFVTVIGPTNPDHLIEDCTADEAELTREEWYMLFRASSTPEALSRELVF
jgi:predicted oxidoreductase